MKNKAIQLLLSLIIFSVNTDTVFGQNRPNILIIIADDMGTDAFKKYNIGTDLPNTPNLDALAEEGILFLNAWAYPTCAPSRASLITGRYGNKNGVMRSGPNLDTEEITLFEHLETMTNDAYANAVFGKWHLGNAGHPNNQGVQHYEGHISSGVADYFNWERTINGVTDVSDTYVTTYITDKAIDWVDQQTEPWLLWMAYNAPHAPIHLPPDSLYTRTQTANNFDRYMCMIESVDHEAGRLYNSLSQEEKDSTLIIFVGDNGTPNSKIQGYPQDHGKGSVYEGGIRVPMFVTGYGVERINEEEDALVSFSDLFATITEMLGQDLPGGMDNSFSFLPLLTDANAATRTYNYSELGETILERAIRDEQYKLITRDDGSKEFYDLTADPYEWDDLLLNGLTSEQQIVMEELQAEADSVFFSWSCQDGILNGNEEAIDCGGSSCQPCSTTSTETAFENEGITIFPNPARHDVQVSIEKGNYNVRLFDVHGRTYKQFDLNQKHHTMDLNSLPQGVYFLSFMNLTTQQVYVKKLLKH